MVPGSEGVLSIQAIVDGVRNNRFCLLAIFDGQSVLMADDDAA
jgi:hypothetical protein